MGRKGGRNRLWGYVLCRGQAKRRRQGSGVSGRGLQEEWVGVFVHMPGEVMRNFEIKAVWQRGK
jgi:hypothetical protein